MEMYERIELLEEMLHLFLLNRSKDSGGSRYRCEYLLISSPLPFAHITPAAMKTIAKGAIFIFGYSECFHLTI